MSQNIKITENFSISLKILMNWMKAKVLGVYLFGFTTMKAFVSLFRQLFERI